jgi:hypothetical protein
MAAGLPRGHRVAPASDDALQIPER